MKKQDTAKKALALHKKFGGKLHVSSIIPVRNRADLSLVYTPGVAAVSSYVAKHPEDARTYTMKGRMVAVISDGSAVLGLGNIGALGALPVMEGKCALFKTFAGVDAVPIVLDTQAPDEIVETVIRIAPAFGGINLEDIAAPKCFDIERRIIDALDIPVMHDDQHGTAIVVLAGLINAVKVVGKKFDKDCWVTVSGVGAAGVATMRLLKKYAPHVNILAVDSKGVVWKGREDLNTTKALLIEEGIVFAEEGGDLEKALIDTDVFIGVSKPGLVTAEMIKSMSRDPIIFAMANPTPEIMPDEAKRGGAAVIATGRSDFSNQINNSLAFPGVFRGALDNKVRKITDDIKLNAAKAIAALVPKPTAGKIVPDMFDKRVAKAVAKVIR
ncbi:NADP-dependent malic enzyme [Candidatus Parcubacteria bacterium]|nr:MAG: NADP-dependent malic enzyme [Candidatus Parcubacteria bacterium]